MSTLLYNAVSQASVVSTVKTFASKQCLSRGMGDTALVLTYENRCFRDRLVKMYEIWASHCLIPTLPPPNISLAIPPGK